MASHSRKIANRIFWSNFQRLFSPRRASLPSALRVGRLLPSAPARTRWSEQILVSSSELSSISSFRKQYYYRLLFLRCREPDVGESHGGSGSRRSASGRTLTANTHELWSIRKTYLVGWRTELGGLVTLSIEKVRKGWKFKAPKCNLECVPPCGPYRRGRTRCWRIPWLSCNCKREETNHRSTERLWSR